MSIIFNSTTPAAPSGAAQVGWQTDVSGNLSGYVYGAAGGVLAKTANYTVTAADSGSLIVCNSSSAFTVTLPSSAPAATNKWSILIRNENTGVITVSPNGLTIDGKSSNITLHQGDAVIIFSDGSNYFTGSPRVGSIGIFAPGVGSNSQILLYLKLDRVTIFPANAPNSYGVASVAATGSTTYTLSKNGTSFATVVFSASGTTGAWTQASDTSFAAGDILEIAGPATADATLANVGITLQGYRF